MTDLLFVDAPLSHTISPSCLYIGGEWVEGHGSPLDTFNPATEEKLGTIDTASKEDIDAAVSAARKCFETEFGLNMAGSDRGALLWKFADVGFSMNTRVELCLSALQAIAANIEVDPPSQSNLRHTP